MNTAKDKLANRASALLAIVAVTVLLAACAGTPETPAGAAQARAELARLQSDATLAPLAPESLRDAEAAVQAAEQPERAEEVASHRVYIANRRVEIARAVAEARRAEEQRKELVAAQDRARLEQRTMEADSARIAAANAQREAAELQQELNAKATDRGLVLTLGDVLFETGRADLKAGSIADLDKLAEFLKANPDRTVTIEGYTDNVGSEDYNLGLSQRRADSVRSYLMRQGVDTTRLTSKGLGESVPVASNESAGGRQQNRRVEIIVSNPPTAASR